MSVQKRPKSSIPTFNLNLKSTNDSSLPPAAAQEHPPTWKTTNESPQAIVPTRRQRGGGPRTKLGKQRSKQNATKYGIYSQVVLLRGEPRIEFDDLLKGLRDDYKPQGMFARLLVDLLATHCWRYRRVLIAEAAEIRKGTELLGLDDGQEQFEVAFSQLSFGTILSLISGIGNPKALDECLALLERLRRFVEMNGFNEDDDRAILTKIYGVARPDGGTRTLLDIYDDTLKLARVDATTPAEGESPSLEDCKVTFLNLLGEEIGRLNRLKAEQALIELKKIEIESLRRTVPLGPALDRLLRYEAALSRKIDRTLDQLERIQRMQMGQNVPPTLRIKLGRE
jgi:hypothetical protein